MANGHGWTLRYLPAIMILVVLVCAEFVDGDGSVQAEHVCRSIDIRNVVSNFKKLENCTVIEGFLRILLIDNADSREYENLSFPKLREITDYFLLYRATGLTSLKQIFPNLAVIRGRDPLHHYSFMIFEMPHLTEIGLKSLTNIVRGSVFINKNPSLCFVNTIDWRIIVKTDVANNIIMDNKKLCDNECPSNCQRTPHCNQAGNTFGDDQCRVCWSRDTCQKVSCKEPCKNGMKCVGDQCCHAQCLGGCTGPTSSNCTVCLNVLIPAKQMCLQNCFAKTYLFMDRRCIEEHVCHSINISSTIDKVIHYKAFQTKCRPDCPAGYMENEAQPHQCLRCPRKCPKVCPGINVNSVSAAQALHGCTTINGSLTIQVKGGSNIIDELEKNLNAIEEITGYLKIIRSFPLISLNFLRNLTTIRGLILDQNGYALLVFDNQNLQALWDWDARNKTTLGGGSNRNDYKPTTKMEILNGKVFFHVNPRLCFSKIKEMKKYVAMPAYNNRDFDDRDVSPLSNGDRAACEVDTLDVTVLPRSETAILMFQNYKSTLLDKRLLIGYVVYYREAIERNLTIYDGHDACGFDLWASTDVAAPDSNDSVISLITQLKPFTQYGLYVRTYSLNTYATGNMVSRGAQSDIIYFTTLQTTPSQPLNVMAASDRYDEVVVTWDPPKNPNGKIGFYKIQGFHETHSEENVWNRNYCEEPLKVYRPPTKDDSDSATKWSDPSSNKNSSDQCCSCKEDSQKISKDEQIAEEKIILEDIIQNLVFVKKNEKVNPRRTRSISRGIDDDKSFAQFLTTELPNVISSTEAASNENDTREEVRKSSFKSVVDKPKVFHASFRGLKHFTEYSVEVQACLSDNNFIDGNNSACSMADVAIVRTLPMGGADDILSLPIVKADNASSGSVFVKWEAPEDPNGVVIFYTIEYGLTSDPGKPSSICVPQWKHLSHQGEHLTKLLPGQYSLRIRASSLAGPGNWSSQAEFYIPTNAGNVASHTVGIVLAVVILVIIILSSLGGWYYIRKKLGLGVPDGVLYASVNPEYISAGLVYEPDEWEVPREKISLIKELGQGSFGMVWAGEGFNLEPGKASTKCAVKTVNDSASLREKIEFLQEASVMKAFTCHHVVKLLGVVSKGQPTLVIMELMDNGDLKTYLRSHRPDEDGKKTGQQPPTLRRIFQMAIEIADGMAYLAARKFVHRDLAARNCMVADDLTVKIGDFGMTRDIYETDYYRKGGKGLLPVRWMAPESLKDGVFDSQSDVWSYGIVLWEMSTLASQPYQGLSNEQVLKYVMSGGIMESPENCPDKLYALMKLCWEKNPKARPTFIELIEVLLPDTNVQFRENSFYFTQRPDFCGPGIEDYSEDLVTPTTPLKSTGEGGLSIGEIPQNSTDENYRFFPSATVLPAVDENAGCSSNGHPSRTISVEDGEENNHSNQGSKVSSLSNGSLVNGHICLPSVRTTTC